MIENLVLKKIGIIGSGVVGGSTGKGFHRLGHDVLFYDIYRQRLLDLREKGYQVASSVQDIIDKTDVSFVCVNTPNNSKGEQDLSQLMSVLYDIANVLRNMNRQEEEEQHHPHLIVFRSTMLPGTMRNVVMRYLQSNCPSSKIGKDYDICYNPEFLRQNTALDDFFRPDRVVIGEDRRGAAQPLKEIYQQQLTDNIIVTSFEAAEMIKYTSNCFLSLKISFFNEIGLVCKQLGIDEKAVSLGVSMDKRIGNYGTQFGKPFEGACLPKDTQALAGFIGNLQMNPDLLKVALDINRKMEELVTADSPSLRK
ncbi:MAG TPA: nucleotide sugar dehydrogenase [Nitrososphaeraceae archaeon]|nr:nucleotide sugar dehydrogenase [Nitrososphaeraceae archaeon]